MATNTKKKSVSKIEMIGTYDFAKNADIVYGADIMGSSYQQGRQFVDINDGLKIAYRHRLQTLLEAPNKMVKVSWIIGESMKTVHFHGDNGAEDVIYSLVNDYHMVLCQGNSGSRTMTDDKPGAAARYPEVMMRPEIKEQLRKLMYLVPEEETITGAKEKRYIPTPIPLALMTGTEQGMGLGFVNKLPALTAKSMLNAYRKNNYKLLRPNYGYTFGRCYDKNSWFDTVNNEVIKGCDILELQDSEGISDWNKEQLKELWTNGVASLEMSIPLYNTEVHGIQGFVAVCDPAIFKPKASKKLLEWEDEGLVEIHDYSDEIGKWFVGITKGTRKLKLDELRDELINKCGIIQRGGLRCSYKVNVAVDNTTGPVGIGQWIAYTYSNYKKLYSTYVNDELDKLDFMERVWRNFKFVAELLISKSTKDMSDEQIVKKCNSDPKQKKVQIGKDRNGKTMIFDCNLDVVKFIADKPIGTLRKDQNIQDRLNKIYEDRNYFNNVVPDNEITTFIDTLETIGEID